MLGIRRRNYEHDRNMHSQAWPSFQKFLDLQSWQDISDQHVRNILYQRAEFDPIYHASLASVIKHPWSGMESVKENHSQSWQDWFVLTALDGKTHGYWLELGGSDPIYMNNTYLLESKFGWQGISIDKRDNLLDEWHYTRSVPLRVIDALESDWNDILRHSPAQIDYLQVDLADWASLEVLEKLPHDSHRFSVITFEHDIFQASPEIQKKSRDLLTHLGYHLLISNVAVKNYATNTWEPFEDWWVDPDVVCIKNLSQISDVSANPKIPYEIFVQQ